MRTFINSILATGIGLSIIACSESSTDEHGDSTHTHADGTVHGDHDESQGSPPQNDQQDADPGHTEKSLGVAQIGEMNVELAQGHGVIAPGLESHLVVKLPYNDNGETVVRAWIGTEDRTLSFVGRGEYAPSQDRYDIHAEAPDPLPANTMWWIEIERPEGTKVVGSAKPVLE